MHLLMGQGSISSSVLSESWSSNSLSSRFKSGKPRASVASLTLAFLDLISCWCCLFFFVFQCFQVFFQFPSFFLHFFAFFDKNLLQNSLIPSSNVQICFRITCFNIIIVFFHVLEELFVMSQNYWIFGPRLKIFPRAGDELGAMP